MASDNRTLAKFDLVGIPPAPRGVPQIEVSFEIDADGILHVSAKDLATNKEQKIQIKASSGLSEEEIKKMEEQAKAHEEEDKRKLELIQTRNQADTLIYSVEKSLRDLGDKVAADEKQKIEDAVKDLKKAMGGEDVLEIRAKMEALQKASYKVAEEAYKTASQQAGPQTQGPSPEQGAKKEGEEEKKAGEEEVKADYEVIDEEEKKD